jgi:Uma2 family endonuclease
VRTIRTAEELFAVGDIGRCELVRGELIMMMPPGGLHGLVVTRIASHLLAYAEPQGLGSVLTESGYVLSRDPDTVRGPDVSFLRAGREVPTAFIEGAPDLVVEVVSPGDRPGMVREKVAEWLEAGASAVWVVDPRARTVVVHVAGRDALEVKEDETLSGDPVLPGFELPLARLFQAQRDATL